jgi:hypothetical protein
MHESSLFFSWGPPRMGTTWLFNVLQEIVFEIGVELKVVADGVSPPQDSWDGPILLKSHRADSAELIQKFDQELDLFALVIVRNIEPTLKSLIRTQKVGVDELLDWLETDLSAYLETLPRMNRVAVMAEEWLSGQGPQVIHLMSVFVGSPLPESQCNRIAKEFSRENVKKKIDLLEDQNSWKGDFTNYDATSQWHAGHVALGESPNLILTDQQTLRVGSLQTSVDSLLRNFSLWDVELVPTMDTGSKTQPMEFIRARQLTQAPVAYRHQSILVRLKEFVSRRAKE